MSSDYSIHVLIKVIRFLGIMHAIAGFIPNYSTKNKNAPFA